MDREPEAGLEFKAKDKAWYAGTARFEGPLLRIHFQHFGEDEDERWSIHKFKSVEEIRRSIRPSSQPMQDEQCSSILPGRVLCAACRRPNSKCFEYYDAKVLKVRRFPHKVGLDGQESCACEFQVSWLGGPLHHKSQHVRCGDICFLVDGDIEDDPVIREYVRQISSLAAVKTSVAARESKENNVNDIPSKRRMTDTSAKLRQLDVAGHHESNLRGKGSATENKIAQEEVKGNSVTKSIEKRTCLNLVGDYGNAQCGEGNDKEDNSGNSNIVQKTKLSGSSKVQTCIDMDGGTQGTNLCERYDAAYFSAIAKRRKLTNNSRNYTCIDMTGPQGGSNNHEKGSGPQLSALASFPSEVSDLEKKRDIAGNVSSEASLTLRDWYDRDCGGERNMKAEKFGTLLQGSQKEKPKLVVWSRGLDYQGPKLVSVKIEEHDRISNSDISCKQKVAHPVDSARPVVFNSSKYHEPKLVQVKSEDHAMERNTDIQHKEKVTHSIDTTRPVPSFKVQDIIDLDSDDDLKPLLGRLEERASQRLLKDELPGSNADLRLNRHDIVEVKKKPWAFSKASELDSTGVDRANITSQIHKHDTSGSIWEDKPHKASLQYTSVVQGKVAPQQSAPPPLVGESRNHCAGASRSHVCTGYSSPSSCHAFECSWRKDKCSHEQCLQESSSTCSISSRCPHYQSAFNDVRKSWGHCASSTSCGCWSNACQSHCCHDSSVVKSEPSYEADGSSKEVETICDARKGCEIAKEVQIWSPSQLLLIENLEKDMTSSKALRIVSKVSHGAVIVYIWPSLEYERTRKGYICYQDSHAAEIAYTTFSQGKLLIVSSKGRPWVISQPKLDSNDWNLLHGVCVSASLKEEEAIDFKQSEELQIVYHGMTNYPLALGKHKLFLEQRKELQFCHLRFSKEEEEVDFKL